MLEPTIFTKNLDRDRHVYQMFRLTEKLEHYCQYKIYCQDKLKITSVSMSQRLYYIQDES